MIIFHVVRIENLSNKTENKILKEKHENGRH